MILVITVVILISVVITLFSHCIIIVTILINISNVLLFFYITDSINYILLIS